MEVTNYQQGDEQAILDLFKLVYGKEMSYEFWKWRFADNPTGLTLIKLIWERNQLAGHYAVCPVMMNINGEDYLSALSMTTMTHPDHQGKGVFSSLASHLYQEASDEHDLIGIWGFPNINSHYGFIKKLEWKDICTIPSFSIAVDSIQQSQSDSIQPVEEFSEQHEKAVEALTSGFSIQVKRDIRYLNWRFKENPVNQYYIFELPDGDKHYFAVVKLFETGHGAEIDIVELMFPNDRSIMNQLLNNLLDYFGKERINKINLWMNIHDERFITLERLGFRLEEPITYFGIRPFREVASVSLNDSRQWYFAMSDSDLY